MRSLAALAGVLARCPPSACDDARRSRRPGRGARRSAPTPTPAPGAAAAAGAAADDRRQRRPAAAPAGRRPRPRARRRRGYDFAPLLRGLRPLVRRADLALCHVETPLVPGPPAGYPSFRTPPALARAIRVTGWDACSTASNHTVDAGQAGVESTIRALDRARVRHTGSYASRRAQRRPLILRARGVRVAFLSYTASTNGIPPPHPWSVNLARAGPDPARRPPRAARGRRRGRRQPALGHGVPPLRRRRAAAARAAADALARHHRDRRPARARRPADQARARALGRVRRGQPALEPVERLLPRRDAGRDGGAAAAARARRRARASSGSATCRPGSATRTTRRGRPRRRASRGAGPSRVVGRGRGLRPVPARPPR